MSIAPQIVVGAYLLLLLAAGWRLRTVAWLPRMKALSAMAMLLSMPMMFMIPAAMHRDDGWSDLLMQFGLTLLVCGALCIAGGWSAAWLRARRK